MSEEQAMQDDRAFAASIKAAAPVPQDIPPFQAIFTQAERQLRSKQQTRRRLLGSAAAIAAIAIVAFISVESGAPESDVNFIQVDELMSSTRWQAPSDVLLPTHEFDLYQELPMLLESTKQAEGTLL